MNLRSKGCRLSWGWAWGRQVGAGALASAPGLVASSGRRGWPRSGQWFLGWSEVGPGVAALGAGGPVGGQRGGHSGRPWPSRWPVFTTSLSPASDFSSHAGSLQGERRGDTARHSSKGSAGALRPERKEDADGQGLRNRPRPRGAAREGHVVDVTGLRSQGCFSAHPEDWRGGPGTWGLGRSLRAPCEDSRGTGSPALPVVTLLAPRAGCCLSRI